MPIYKFRCASCGKEIEKLQSMHAAPPRECPACGGKMEKQVGRVGLKFQGSGFYVTDSKNRASASSTAPKKEEVPASGAPKSPTKKNSETKKEAV